jgi:protein-disulfide isomerase
MRLVAITLLLTLLAACESNDGRLWGPDQRVTVELGDAPTLGPTDAQVVVVEFGDFQCPYCGDEEPVVQRLLATYDGRVRFAYKQFPLWFHTDAFLASEAALAAHAQGAFWPYHDLLYAHQAALARADLESYAAELGLDLDAFRAALDEHTFAAAVDADVAQGTALGVPGTPCFFVNGRMGAGALDYDTLAAAIDEELAR